MNRFIYLAFLITAILFFQSCEKGKKEIRVIILSGSNNHDWKSTTSYLQKMYTETGLFAVEITEKPDTLKSMDLNKFDVIVSNWNSWPENDLRWPEETEKALLEFVEKGDGFVTFHAAASAFYKWPEFKKISTAAWVDSTWHGTKSATEVILQNGEHPITKGMSEFFIYDELWVNAEKNQKFQILGTATNKDIFEKGIENQPAILISNYGKGIIFHTILGHDVRTMRNTGFRTLMLRGTEWAATGKVLQVIPQEIQKNSTAKVDYGWAKTDTSLALQNGPNIVWKYNFNTKHGKPFFHPVFVGNNNITCVSPDDHLWHLGQWFSWKFINGVNYWEYQNGTYQSEGITEIRDIQITQADNFSAEIQLDIVYHPIEGENVMVEKRQIKISEPIGNGNIYMDYKFEFEALADSVNIDRTPILGEPNGMSWGGYGGLSVRFNQDFMDSHFISVRDENDNINGMQGDWLYMGFTGLDGNKVGTQIIISPQSHREEAAWYIANTDELPFYYFSPAYLFNEKHLLLKGEKLKLNYRINHFAGSVKLSKLEDEFQKYEKNQNQ